MQSKLPKHTVVLLGVGHTNAHVLRMWRMRPIKDARLICISNAWKATYSGMLPGVLANQYPIEQMEIDLVRLCASAGARLVVDEVTGFDLENQRILFRDRAEISFDALSIGVGSVPSTANVEAEGESLLAIKPMQSFLPRLHAKLSDVVVARGKQPVRIAVVGAGAGGTEIALCLPLRLTEWFPDAEFELSLVTSNSHVASGCISSTVRLVEQELQARKTTVHTGKRVRRVDGSSMTFDDGSLVEVDVAIWATGATAPDLLTNLGLETDSYGFLLTQPDLRVVGGHPIFAVGDSGTLQDSPTLKAGVFAVRQGPVLWRNLRRLLKNEPLEPYRPQRDFLTLLNLGDGRAIAQYKGMSFRGKWCWRLKDYIDSKFMDKYQDYKPMEMKPEPPDTDAQMRCTGCGGKVGGSVLSRVLRRLRVPQNEHVLVGLDEPDDAAVIRSPGGRPMTVTADFFTAPLDDPYIVGRIAALNSASDVFAIGAKPLAALALVTVPVGSPRRQEQVLYETLAGSMHEFRQMDTSLAGGHTIEGPTLTVGFTVLADQGSGPPRTKGRIRAGDQLVLTKPLGSGILLAGHMQALCEADWMESLLATMLLSNQPASTLIDHIDIQALTDITGFGLAGHLLEMLRPAGLSAELRLNALPLLPGTSHLIKRGIESTLAPANKDAESSIQIAENLRESPEYLSIFDPQTCGGLLLCVDERDVETVLSGLRAQSDVPSAVIGRVTQSQHGSSEIRITE